MLKEKNNCVPFAKSEKWKMELIIYILKRKKREKKREKH